VSTGATQSIGAPHERVDARAKVTGQARYAVEQPMDAMAHAVLVTATVAAGEIVAVDAAEALALPGVLAVLSHENAPRVQPADDGELLVLQSPKVSYRGQIVACAVADSLEVAQDAAERVRVRYEQGEHDVVLRAGHPKLYEPKNVNAGFPTTSTMGDLDAGLAEAQVTIDETYSTPTQHNNPMEPHATTAAWHDGDLLLHDSSQGTSGARSTMAEVFGLPEGRVRVIAQHVGGGFGSKGTPRPHTVVAAMAARIVERPVRLAVTRRQMFTVTGYRTPTIQRVRLGAAADGTLTAIGHDSVQQTSTLREFAEQTAVITRTMYAGPNRLTSHRLAALDVPSPAWMRAPGECPGMFALESAMDELALACGLDPIELRVRNEPELAPESGERFSSRNLVACLRDGAERFGWSGRDGLRGGGADGLLRGMGVAASVYPAYQSASSARASADPGGGFTVEVAATDIGTGARTALVQIAADALGVDPARVSVEIADSDLPFGPVAGGSAGTASWGSAVHGACSALVARLQEAGGPVCEAPVSAEYDTTEDLDAREPRARFAFGAQFAQVAVDPASAEVRCERLLGVFAAGRIINPRTARSQLIGGMVMGLSMALMEETLMDERLGGWVNTDLAGYHVAVNADVREIEAVWLDEHDEHLNPMGSKGIGEIGIVGTAAAVANAVHHATGVRVRDLPIRLDRLVGRLPGAPDAG
jgi:xanthine dehydrogenase YagR molybdenum-binding subunit